MKEIRQRRSKRVIYLRFVHTCHSRVMGLKDIQIIDAIPSKVRQFVTDAQGSPVHGHESLILNLACGPSVNETMARHSLLKRSVKYTIYCVHRLPDTYNFSHCADAVLSLSNHATVVSEVATELANFAALWAQSLSDYDFIISTTMTADWAGKHHPILSRVNRGHTLYTRYRRWEPQGQLVRCHNNCKDEIQMNDRSKNILRFTCLGCKSRCRIPKSVTDLDKSTNLGKKLFVKVSFPRTQYPTPLWELPPPKDEAVDSNPGIGPGISAITTLPRAMHHQLRLVPPEPIVRASSLPLPPPPTASAGPSSSSTSLRIRLPPLTSRSRSTSSIVDSPTPSSSQPPSTEARKDDSRKRPTNTKTLSKTIKRQKKK